MATKDSKSLYDNIHRDGSLKVPSERFLVMGLAAIHEMLS